MFCQWATTSLTQPIPWVRFLILLSLWTTAITFAQPDPWRTSDSGLEFNCVSVNAMIEAINGEATDLLNVADLTLIRDGTTEVTVAEYLALIVQQSIKTESDVSAEVAITTAQAACEDFSAEASDAEVSASSSAALFNVITPNSVNLRDCASTSCGVVRQSRAGELFAVVGVESPADGDWYQIEVDDGYAFVAARVVSRGPDGEVVTGEAYLDSRTGCVLVVDARRGSADVQFILSGDSRRSVTVDITRPNETVPLRVQSQLDKTFIDTGEPYVQQYYSFSVGWPTGIYQIDISNNDESSRLSWNMTERATYNIYVQCGDE